MYQEKLIRTIQQKVGQEQSLIDAIAAALSISYDAAHRRISMKSKFSLEETALLARYFGVSLDSIFQGEENVLVQKTKEIQNFQDLAAYLQHSLQALQRFDQSAASVYYSAKDIPLFYTIGNSLLSKFKLFVWLNLLGSKYDEVNFDDFQFQAPMQETSQRMVSFYDAVQVNEVWNDTTINSTLQQIIYYFQAGLLGTDTALGLCDSLKELVHDIEKKCTEKNERYRLFYHDLLILNNNVLVNDGSRQSLFVPYTMLGYFITDDSDTCAHALKFYEYQLKNSKLLNTAGKRDKKIFFNKAYQKIDFYRNQIKVVMDFG